MRMFQSSSRHSSQQSTAHNSSQPTVSQLKGVSDTISNWYENHRPQRTQIYTVPNAAFRSKLDSDGLQVDRNRKFSERIFSIPATFKTTSMLFGSLSLSEDKTRFDLSSIFFKICRFCSSIRSTRREILRLLQKITHTHWLIFMVNIRTDTWIWNTCDASASESGKFDDLLS